MQPQTFFTPVVIVQESRPTDSFTPYLNGQFETTHIPKDVLFIHLAAQMYCDSLMSDIEKDLPDVVIQLEDGKITISEEARVTMKAHPKIREWCLLQGYGRTAINMISARYYETDGSVFEVTDHFLNMRARYSEGLSITQEFAREFFISTLMEMDLEELFIDIESYVPDLEKRSLLLGSLFDIASASGEMGCFDKASFIQLLSNNNMKAEVFIKLISQFDTIRIDQLGMYYNSVVALWILEKIDPSTDSPSYTS